ncbi:helix-turn-helix domain-containing protein [Spirosoma endbachense]|uniref:Helix-turn-helix domain-containing protein n=1 Tax=Spirosoma endbachense TaxID=2666025 RepID=A0A6P1VNE5_9BACT|nr:helix-turn-helix domain-containing protein [Spirosoma endbachense]QHV94225.1 helix-turn-helix domain-containing protein [Spirosoma endbachense]
MNKSESTRTSDFNTELKLKGFKVYETDSKSNGHNYSRKDFYKISLTSGKYIFHYADKSFETDEPILFFGNPRIPYSCEIITPTMDGYACLFTDDFLKVSDRSESLLQSPLFKLGGTPILTLDTEQKDTIATIFQKMLVEQDSDYAFKDELIRNYLNLIIHEALKIQPSESYPEHKNAAVRITSVFLELLERQFPIESINHPLELKTAQDFAKQLSVHVNHLNSSVKEVTGKPTTVHIAERIISEAKALLQHTNWTIADIAYALGFEYTTYFNNFFKKKTGEIPKSVRAASL